MTKEQVIKIREMYKAADINNLEVFCDNGKVMYSGIEGCVLIWDDVNEIVSCVRKNTDQYQGFKDVHITSTTYEFIQYLIVYSRPIKFESYLSGLVTDGVITEELKSNILQTFK